MALPSFVKFDYTLRPSKQVERKLLIELLHRLGTEIGAYDIRRYTYLGFGSVYYTDFVLFHKYLYIDRMICVESEDIPKRMEFNRPYDFIQLHMAPFSDVLPKLDRETRYVMWLDYDTGITLDQMQDIRGAISVLAPGSIILITVDGEPRIPFDIDKSGMTRDEKKAATVGQLEEQFGSLLAEPLRLADFTPNSFPRALAKIIGNQIAVATETRGDLEFAQLVNFRYKDGAQMLSLGGVLDSADRVRELRESGVMNLAFVNAGAEPVTISVPPLTIREKLWLDQHSDPVDLVFEMDEEMVESFQRYRRYYPRYHEVLL